LTPTSTEDFGEILDAKPELLTVEILRCSLERGYRVASPRSSIESDMMSVEGVTIAASRA